MMVISIACSLETWRTMAGTVALPARWEASQRRSPVMSWKRPAMLADGDGLNDAGDLDGFGELVEGGFVEVGAGLVGIAVDQLDGDARGRCRRRAAAGRRPGSGSGRLDAAGGGKQGFETASEGFSFVMGRSSLRYLAMPDGWVADRRCGS